MDRADGSWPARLRSALERRVANAWRRLAVGDHSTAAEAALDWLLCRGAGHGLVSRNHADGYCPGLSAAALVTAAAYGQREAARRWAQWLMAIQRPDGALPAAGSHGPSIFNTGQAARGWLAIGNDLPGAMVAARRACEYLVSRIGADGQPRLNAHCGSCDPWLPPPVLLVGFSALANAATRLNEPAWREALDRLVRGMLRRSGLIHWDVPSPFLAQAIEALLEVGDRRHALEALRPIEAAQRRDGAVPAHWGSLSDSTQAVAHLAKLWCQIGELDRAERAIGYLARRQTAEGDFREHARWSVARRRHGAAPWTVVHFLDASRALVEASFKTHADKLPEDIHALDPRLQAIQEWLSAMPPVARVADVGCGKGRYLRRLAPSFPNLRFTGIDTCAALLAHLPAWVDRRCGDLLCLSAADGEFDAAFAIEVLEHTLVPRQAIAELCRIVRPGGQVLIIDKRRSHQALSLCEPWERWFTPEEVRGWLAPCCDGAAVAGIHMRNDRRRECLFLCWTATRRATASCAAA